MFPLSLLLGAAIASEPANFDAQWDYHDPAATEVLFREHVEASQEWPLDDRLQLQTQIARTLGLQGRFDEGHAVLDAIEPLLSSGEQSQNPPREAHVRYLLERGRLFNSGGSPARAHHYFFEAWVIGQAADLDGRAVDAAHMLAIVEPPEDAMRWNQLAMNLAESSEDESAKRWLGALYNNIGWTLHDLERYDEALVTLQKGLEWRIERGTPGPIRIAKYSVGRALRSLERYDEAMEIQSAVAAELAAEGKTDGYVEEELGELLLIAGDSDAASDHFANAWTELSADSWMVANEGPRLERLRELAMEKLPPQELE